MIESEDGTHLSPEAAARGGTGRRGLRIPDLCSGRPVLFLSLIGVLLALCLVLFESGLSEFDWIGLGRTAAFICWNMLASAAVLCALAPRIARWSLPAGATAALVLILGTCVLSSLGQRWLLRSAIGGYPFSADLSALVRNLLICGLLGMAALRYFHLQGELIERERAELDARIRALQARIRPHFLFNSMNIIASLIPVAPEQAERAVEDLAELFRASLREGGARCRWTRSSISAGATCASRAGASASGSASSYASTPCPPAHNCRRSACSHCWRTRSITASNPSRRAVW